ncbi:MAG TPA: hypothetical protein VLB68_03745 [Pyrinomonadaceae bacterium]|nr:hypothetical protein [Pyrinomonadaceae bacterium]
MLSRHMKQYSLLIFVLLLGLRTAEACSCGSSGTVLDAYNHADVVVIVSVASVEKAEPEKTAPKGQMSNDQNYVDGIKSTTMRIDEVFKGTLKVGAEMVFAQGGGADCIWTFAEEDIGRKFLFYLKRFNNSTVWVAGTCGRSSQVDQAGDDLLYLRNLDKVRDKTRISGTMRFLHENDESLAGRKVRIVGDKRAYELKTDDQGVYEIYDLPAGRYFVETEVPKGWKIGSFWLRYSPSLDPNAEEGSLQKIPIVLEAKKHAALDIMFEIDNVLRGHIYDPLGQPMKGVCIDLIPSDGTKGAYLADCTEEDGAFKIDEIPPGGYVLVVNDDGKITSSEPFGTFYYPKVTKREEATVFTIGLGDIVENLEIYPPIAKETITVEGVLLYSDGKPVADESVFFKSLKKQSSDKNEEDENDDRAKTDSQGRFSVKILKGTRGSLVGGMFTYSGEFENCPKLERLIKQSGSGVPEITTPPVEIRATTNLYGVELKYQFPYCKKAESPDQ